MVRQREGLPSAAARHRKQTWEMGSQEWGPEGKEGERERSGVQRSIRWANIFHRRSSGKREMGWRSFWWRKSLIVGDRRRATAALTPLKRKNEREGTASVRVVVDISS